MRGRLNEQPHHAFDCIRRAVRRRGERKNRRAADHGEREGILGHRLSTLARKVRDELLDLMPLSVVPHDLSPTFVSIGDLQNACDRVDRTLDGAREGKQRPDDQDGDHSQDDAVLGHRLPLLDLEPGAEVMDQIREH